jgi:hypothetical protein
MIETLLSALVLAGGLLGRVLPFMIMGVIVAELIVTLGFVNKMSFVAQPITRFSHLKHECGVSFLMAFGSLTAANAMLAQYREKGLISKREMFLAAMINSFPGILMHWQSMLPALLPLLGTIGLVYFLILVLIGIVKTALVMVASRFLLPARPEQKLSLETKSRPPLKEAFMQSLKSSRRIIKRMVIITVPTMLIMSILIKLGVFDSLASYLSGVSVYLPVPVGGLGIIAAMFGHHIAAYTVASNLLATGEIAARGIILSLLIGSVLTSIISMFRYQIPHYVGIYGLKTGIQLMLLSSTIRSVIIIVFIVILARFW